MADEPRRYSLHADLCEMLGSRNVYFQPPESFKLNYPCIVYELSRRNQRRADNRLYTLTSGYTVTYISSNPDDSFPERLAALEKCSFDRRFVSDGLYHDVFTLYY